MKKIIIIILLLMFALPSEAHQPRIVTDNLILVSNPEISQAFYAELNGESQIYIIDSEVPFELYVGLTVPDVEGAETDFTVSIEKALDHEDDHGHEDLLYLDGRSYLWKSFYEEFGGDDYLSGPEVTQQVEAGIYDIIVSSPDNQGKYVLAIGKKEEFPLDETINAIITIPTLKQDFFNKPAYTGIFTLFNLLTFVPIILAVIIIYLIFRKTKKR